MSTTPKISVIIPCYNAERYIVSAISSVFAQDWPNLEVVVVDDGSSDRSAELICASFPEVRLVQQRNQGIAVSRATMASHAHRATGSLSLMLMTYGCQASCRHSGIH